MCRNVGLLLFLRIFGYGMKMFLYKETKNVVCHLRYCFPIETGVFASKLHNFCISKLSSHWQQIADLVSASILLNKLHICQFHPHYLIYVCPLDSSVGRALAFHGESPGFQSQQWKRFFKKSQDGALAGLCGGQQ